MNMECFEDRICGIRDKVISERLPELSPLEIRVDIEEDSDELLGYGELSGGGYYVDVDIEMKKDKKLKSPKLKELIEEHFGITIHKRSIERAIKRRKKNK